MFYFMVLNVNLVHLMKYSQIIIIVNNLCFLIVNYLGNSNTSIIIIISNGFLDWAQGLGPINDVAQSSMWHPVVHSTESGLHFSHFQCYPLMPRTTNHTSPLHHIRWLSPRGKLQLAFPQAHAVSGALDRCTQCRDTRLGWHAVASKTVTNLNAATNGQEHATCPEDDGGPNERAKRGATNELCS